MARPSTQSHYARGREVEYRAVEELRALGYHAQRAASSKGSWDVVAVGSERVLLVSCKRVKDERAARRVLASERKKLIGLRDGLPKESVAQALWIWADTLPERPRGGWHTKEEL